MNLFYFLSPVLGIAMRFMYQLIQNYGWTIILFTILIRVVTFPLSLKQQKSTARMTAYQPMIQEIQKKWANDKNRQNQEMQKFYEENNIKMSAGCLPSIINMIVIFGIIGVIQAPLTHILNIDDTQVKNGVAIVQQHIPDSNISTDTYTQQSILIGEVKKHPEWFSQGVTTTQKDADGKEVTANVTMDSAVVKQIDDFDFEFMGLNMAAAPNTADWVTLIMPILSIVTMLASQVIIMLTSGNAQGRNQMLIMTLVMGVMFGFFAFRVPVGFSLYYTISNVVMTLQQILLKRIYDPEKIRAEVEQEIAERKAAKKAKKKVVVTTENGETVAQELTEAELVKLRLAKARELDAQRYGDDTTADEQKALEKARQQDEENTDGTPEPEKGEDDAADEAKPGRRKRARSNKENADNAARQQAEAEDVNEEEQQNGGEQDA